MKRNRIKREAAASVLAVFGVIGAALAAFLGLRAMRAEEVGAGAGLPASAFVDQVEPTAEFMDSYYQGMAELRAENNQENILIVTSLTGMTEVYGATKVVVGPNHQYFLQYADAEAKTAALAALQESAEVAYVDENVIRTVDSTTSTEGETGYNSWGIAKMQIDGILASMESRTDLEPVLVAVIDTGCDMDLVNKYYRGKVTQVYNVVSEDHETMTDEHGHGTHVIGTIAEGTPANVTILAIKISNDGQMSTTDILAGIYAAHDKGADVINMSFEGAQMSKAEEVAMQSVLESGAIAVAAAGNSGTSVTAYPAGFDSTISIGAVSEDLSVTSFSNYGKTLDFVAPGNGIKSLMSNAMTMAEEKKPDDGPDHGTADGTSMAAPHVTSMVAIMKSMNKGLNLEQTRTLLRQHAIDLGDSGRDDYYGYGFVNFANSELCGAEKKDCDEYGVFKKNDVGITQIEIEGADTDGAIHLAYSYGNLTDLMNIKVKISYGDSWVLEKYLYELVADEKVTIDGYDSTVSYDAKTGAGVQMVTLDYYGEKIEFKVANQGLQGWKYDIAKDGTVTITGINYGEDVADLPLAIEIPSTLEGKPVATIGEEAFDSKSNIVKVKIPDSVVQIDKFAFFGCAQLREVQLSSNLKVIGDKAFAGTDLQSIELPEGLLTIGKYAFFGTKLADIHIPASVSSIQPYAFAATTKNLQSITVDANNATYNSGDNGNYIAETKSHTIIKGFHQSVIGDDITVIGQGAFAYEGKMQGIVIPEQVTEIQEEAYASIYINGAEAVGSLQVRIRDNVKTIDEKAFGSGELDRSESDTETLDTKKLALMILTDYGSAAMTYAHEQQIGYLALDYKNVRAELTDGENVESQPVQGHLKVITRLQQGSWAESENEGVTTLAFGELNDEGALYNGDIAEAQGSGLEILYQDENRNTLLATDEYVTVRGTSMFGDYYETRCAVTVTQATPEPEPEKELIELGVSVVDKVYDGTTKIEPEAVIVAGVESNEYEVVEAVADAEEAGLTTARVKIRLTDEKFATHTLADGAQEQEFVVDLTILKAQFVVEDKTKSQFVMYDEARHALQLELYYEGEATVKYRDENGDYTLEQMPEYTVAGNYVIAYMVRLDDNHEDYYGHGMLVIYQPAEAGDGGASQTTITGRDNMITIAMEDDFSSLQTQFQISGSDYAFTHLTSEREEAEGDKVKTGDIMQVTVDGQSFEYELVKRGDINGDGEIGGADCERVVNHIMNWDDFVLEGIYHEAADVNADGKITVIDYIRMIKKIE